MRVVWKLCSSHTKHAIHTLDIGRLEVVSSTPLMVKILLQYVASATPIKCVAALEFREQRFVSMSSTLLARIFRFRHNNDEGRRTSSGRGNTVFYFILRESNQSNVRFNQINNQSNNQESIESKQNKLKNNLHEKELKP